MNDHPLPALAFRNVRRGWRQSLASLLSILAAFCAVALFEGFVADASETVGANYQHLAMLGDVIVEGPDPTSAPELLGRSRIGADAQGVVATFLAERAAEVRTTVRFLYLSGSVGSDEIETVFLGYGFDVDEGALLRGPTLAWNTLGGVPLQESPIPDRVAMGRRLAEALGCQIDPNIDAFLPGGGFRPEPRPLTCKNAVLHLEGTAATGQVTRRDVTVVGVVDAGMRTLETRLVVMPLQLAQTLENTTDIAMYSIALKDPAAAPAFRAALRERLDGAGTPLTIQSWQDHPFFGDFYRRTHAVLTLYERFLFAVVAAVGGMSVTNTVSRTVLERTREIGTLRSLGFTPRWIVGLFAVEGALLGLLACTLGTVLTAAVAGIVSHLGLHYPPGLASFPVDLRIRLVPTFYAELTVLLAAVSAAAAALPAARAARMRVADALRES